MLQDGCIIADGDDSVFFDRERFGDRELGVHRENLGVMNDEIGRFGGIIGPSDWGFEPGGQDNEEGKREEQRSIHRGYLQRHGTPLRNQRVSTVTAITTGAVVSGPFTNSMRSITSGRSGITFK
jgi:hypothetical protein